VSLKERYQVPITLDKERNFFFPNAAYRYVGERHGSMSQALAKLTPSQGGSLDLTPDLLDAFRDLVFAGLMHEDPELKPEDVEQWLGVFNMREVTGQIIKAVVGEQTKAVVNPSEQT